MTISPPGSAYSHKITQSSLGTTQGSWTRRGSDSDAAGKSVSSTSPHPYHDCALQDPLRRGQFMLRGGSRVTLLFSSTKIPVAVPPLPRASPTRYTVQAFGLAASSTSLRNPGPHLARSTAPGGLKDAYIGEPRQELRNHYQLCTVRGEPPTATDVQELVEVGPPNNDERKMVMDIVALPKAIERGLITNEIRAYKAVEGLGIAPRFLRSVTEEGRPIGFLTEYIKGARHPRRDEEEAFIQALKRFHRKTGLCHPDNKAGNFALKVDRVYIIDFEVAGPPNQ
ncbi:hypothetical protein DL767_009719 [Monosporascus sp. MG133]|nr:hypothetical protein DL767_009719 [Monosporascus sp. MG133]